MRIQPDEAIFLKINMKKPGLSSNDEMEYVELDLSYKERLAAQVSIPRPFFSYKISICPRHTKDWFLTYYEGITTSLSVQMSCCALGRSLLQFFIRSKDVKSFQFPINLGLEVRQKLMILLNDLATCVQSLTNGKALLKPKPKNKLHHQKIRRNTIGIFFDSGKNKLVLNGPTTHKLLHRNTLQRYCCIEWRSVRLSGESLENIPTFHC